MRAFIAIDLPNSLREAMGRQQSAYRTLSPEARWTRPEGIHLTLKFLGQISDAQVGEVSQALAAIPPLARFTIELKGYGFFPDSRRPRVFWVGVEAPPALGELVNRVEDTMAGLGFLHETREFTPHLTLARFNETRPQTALLAAVEKQANRSLGRFETSEFFLFESRLSPQGASYRKVRAFS